MILDYPKFYFLDTNAASAFMKGKDERLVGLVLRYRTRLRLSSIVLSELDYGAKKNPQWRRYRENLVRLREYIADVEPFDEQAAKDTGTVRAYLENLKPNAQKIGPIDALIAGHALSRRSGVVTHNVGEFGRVPGLVVLNWQTVR